MKKHRIASLAVAASLLAGAGSAYAALDINIYGASAQYAFLRAVGDDILIGNGCAAGDITGPLDTALGTQTIYSAVSTNAVAGSLCATQGGFNLRIANKSSRDGIKTTLGTAGAGGCALGQAPFILSAAAPNTIGCLPVTFGASDVAAGTYNETTSGCEYGPVLNAAGYCTSPDPNCIGGAGNPNFAQCTKKCTVNNGAINDGSVAHPEDCWRSNNFAGALSSAGLAVGNPMVLPFSFFVNNTVQVNKCAQDGGANAGRLCDPTLNVAGPDNPACNDGAAHACLPQTLDNVSRIMATQIFSQGATDWQDFGTAFTSTSNGGVAPNTAIRACIRQAGSGSLATLNEAVMVAKWGKALVQNGNALCDPVTNPGSLPACLPSQTGAGNVAAIWYNSSTDDLLNCVNKLPNAIGAADADACTPTSPYTQPANNAYGINLCANISQTAYNGVKPYRENVRNGQYDFWTKENLYVNNTSFPAGTPTRTFFTNMLATLTPSVLTEAKVGDSSRYWTSTTEMRFVKSTDLVYPTKPLLPPSTPQKP